MLKGKREHKRVFEIDNVVKKPNVRVDVLVCVGRDEEGGVKSITLMIHT